MISKYARMHVFPFYAFSLGAKSIIEDYSIVNNKIGNVFIGEQTRIGIGSVLIGPVIIGNNVKLAQNVVVSALNHNYQDVTRPIAEQGVSTKTIIINDDSLIGSNVVIEAGIKIGKHCVVSDGSIVTIDVPDYSVVAGNPAKVIKFYDRRKHAWIENYVNLTSSIFYN